MTYEMTADDREFIKRMLAEAVRVTTMEVMDNGGAHDMYPLCTEFVIQALRMQVDKFTMTLGIELVGPDGQVDHGESKYGEASDIAYASELLEKLTEGGYEQEGDENGPRYGKD